MGNRVLVTMVALAFCSSNLAQTTRPKFPVLETQPTSRPATKPNPLATPVGSVEYLLKLIKAEDYVAIRGVKLQSVAPSAIRELCAPIVNEYQDGSTVTVVDSKQFNTVASVICKVTRSSGELAAVIPLLVVQRFDDWKVEFGEVSLRRLSPAEREQIPRVLDWNTKRVAELRATTRPNGAVAATAPAAAR